MQPSIHVLALSSFLFVLACGDDTSTVTVDAAPAVDAAVPVPDAGEALDTEACPSTYGLATVARSAVVAEEGVGFDLTGDKLPNNIVGQVGALLNTNLADSIAAGELLFLYELQGVESLSEDLDSLKMVLYGGVDGDSPADVKDNFAGEEAFYYTIDWVAGPNCEPIATLSGTATGGLVDVRSDEQLPFYVAALGGFLQIAHPRVLVELEPDTVGARSKEGTTAMVGGAITQCALATSAGQLGISVQYDLTKLGIQPDIDLDGDGLETLEVDLAETDMECTDGDGTKIPGDTCGCDERMQDGYSIAFLMELVGASILGPHVTSE